MEFSFFLHHQKCDGSVLFTSASFKSCKAKSFFKNISSSCRICYESGHSTLPAYESSFALLVVAMVEIALEETVQYSHVLLTVFSLCTTLLVAVHLLALMISTCILPHVEAVVSVMQSEDVNGQIISQAIRSPHETMHRYIETAWIFSTVLGIILFLIEIGLVCWIRFYSSDPAKLSSTLLLVPIVIVFLFFALQFYRKLVAHTYSGFKNDLEDLEGQFDVFNQQSGIQTV